MNFLEWIAENPPPSLKQLLDEHGSYIEIPEGKWQDYYRAVNEWRERLKRRDQEQWRRS
jgi:hypothetical protein